MRGGVYWDHGLQAACSSVLLLGLGWVGGPLARASPTSPGSKVGGSLGLVCSRPLGSPPAFGGSHGRSWGAGGRCPGVQAVFSGSPASDAQPVWLGLGLGQVWGWAELGSQGEWWQEMRRQDDPQARRAGPPLAQPGLLTDSLLFVSLLLDSLL